jgi:predicted deacylase
MIDLFVEGTTNVLKHYGVIGGAIGRTAADAGMKIGNGAAPIIATHGGLVEYLAKLDEEVKAGQKIAVQRNMFGATVAEYVAAQNGIMAAYRTDSMSEPGNILAFIMVRQPDTSARHGVHADTEHSYPE